MAEMEDVSDKAGESQADFIREELNFDVNMEDPMSKAALTDHPKDEWVDILGSGQLKKKVLKEGQDGMRPNVSNICTLKLVGKLEDGTVVEEYDELVIQIGDVEVIQGLDLAIALMNVEEIAEIEVASRFAYGKLGKKPNVPPDATIWYTVELKSVKLSEEIETLNVSRRKAIGNKKRERGNWWYTRGEPSLAIQCYRRALDFLLPSESTRNSDGQIEESASDAELQSLLEDRIKVYNNLATAQIEIEAYEASLKSIENVLVCQPHNVKALYKKAKVLRLKGDDALAYTILFQVAKLVPEMKSIQHQLAVLKEKNAKYANHEKKLYQKMLGTLEYSNNSNAKNNNDSNKSKIPYKFSWSLIGGAAIVSVIGTLLYKFSS